MVDTGFADMASFPAVCQSCLIVSESAGTTVGNPPLAVVPADLTAVVEHYVSPSVASRHGLNQGGKNEDGFVIVAVVSTAFVLVDESGPQIHTLAVDT